MKPNIFKSRKFWIAIVDAVVSLAGLWVGVLLIPERAELVVATIAIIQLPVAVLINSIAQQNVAAMQSGHEPVQPPPPNLPTNLPPRG